MTNDNHENDTRFETGVLMNGFNNDSTWMNIIILLMLLTIFPAPEPHKTDWVEVIKGAAKTLEDFEKAEEAKKDEN